MGASELTNQQSEDEIEEVSQRLTEKIEQANYDDPSVSEKDKDILMLLAGLKHKEILKETVTEYSRRGNFLRIYPALGTKHYDRYFHY